MSDKYTAEQIARKAEIMEKIGEHEEAAMLRQAAQMMREREVGGVVRDEHIDAALAALLDDPCQLRRGIRKALESFAARRAAVPDAELVLTEYVRICTQEHTEHAGPDDRVLAMRRAIDEAMLAAAPEMTNVSPE